MLKESRKPIGPTTVLLLLSIVCVFAADSIESRLPARGGQTNAEETPVIVRVLEFDTRKSTAYLDLDSGNYVDPGSKWPAFSMNATPAGVDLKASSFESDDCARLGINIGLKPVSTNRWDATPAEIRKELARVRREAEVRLVASETPQTFFFRTSEGGEGVLEIRAFLDPPNQGMHKVRIRYKLIEPLATSFKTSLPTADSTPTNTSP